MRPAEWPAPDKRNFQHLPCAQRAAFVQFLHPLARCTGAVLGAAAIAVAPASCSVADEVRALVATHYLDSEAMNGWASFPADQPATLVRRLRDRYSHILSRQEVAALLSRYDATAGLNLELDPSARLVVGVVPPTGSPADAPDH